MVKHILGGFVGVIETDNSESHGDSLGINKAGGLQKRTELIAGIDFILNWRISGIFFSGDVTGQADNTDDSA